MEPISDAEHEQFVARIKFFDKRAEPVIIKLMAEFHLKDHEARVLALLGDIEDRLNHIEAHVCDHGVEQEKEDWQG